jgi:hypothetical protein
MLLFSGGGVGRKPVSQYILLPIQLQAYLVIYLTTTNKRIGPYGNVEHPPSYFYRTRKLIFNFLFRGS